MGNKIGGQTVNGSQTKNGGQHHKDTDTVNLQLVLDGIRPAYLWYPTKDRTEPPAILHGLHKIETIFSKKIAYWYIKASNTDFIIPKSHVDIGKALGYLFPHQLTNGMHFRIRFIKKDSMLWAEFIPVSANFDWNILAEKIKELSPSDIFIKIDMENITFGNPY